MIYGTSPAFPVNPPKPGYSRFTVTFQIDVFDGDGARTPTEWDWGDILSMAVGEEPDEVVWGSFRLEGPS